MVNVWLYESTPDSVASPRCKQQDICCRASSGSGASQLALILTCVSRQDAALEGVESRSRQFDELLTALLRAAPVVTVADVANEVASMLRATIQEHDLANRKMLRHLGVRYTHEQNQELLMFYSTVSEMPPQ